MSAHELFSPDEGDIESAAAVWLARRDRGFTPDEAAAFRSWLVKDPRHQIAVAELEEAWSALSALQSLRPAGNSAKVDADLLRPAKTHRAIWWNPVWAAAACFLLGFFIWALPRFRGSISADAQSIAPVVYETRVGQQRTLTLTDGSTLFLNTDSAVAVRIGAAARLVDLRRGEVFSSVAKDPQRPFIVSAKGVAVRAVGTAFDVDCTNDRVDVLVTEGTVRIGVPATGATRESSSDNAVSVTKNQRISIPVHGTSVLPRVEDLAPEAVTRTLSWQRGDLDFKQTPLAEIAETFNRYNLVKLKINDAQASSMLFSGRFQAGNVNGFVQMLEANFGLKSERPDPDTILLSRASP